MDIKKTVLKESLYLIGFAIVCGITTFIFSKFSYPEVIKKPVEVSEKPIFNFTDINDRATQLFQKEIHKYVTSADRDSIRARVKDELPNMPDSQYLVQFGAAYWNGLHKIALTRYEAVEEVYQLYLDEKKKIDIWLIVILVVPYILFLKIRLVIWAVRRQKEKTGSPPPRG